MCCIMQPTFRLFRNFKYMCGINPDIKNPQSEEYEHALNLETYDRAIANPLADQEMIYKDFLLSTNPKAKKDPDKYISKQPINPLQTGPSNESPLGNIINKGKGLPQSMPVQQLQ